MKAECKVSIAVWLVLSALLVCFCTGHFGVAVAEESEVDLGLANSAVNQASVAVLDAESAGANVTGLISQLNTAAELLAKAEMDFRKGDQAANIAVDSVVSIANEVEAAAFKAKSSALVASQNELYVMLPLCSVNAVLFVVVLYLVWDWLRYRHVEEMLKGKPEVREQ